MVFKITWDKLPSYNYSIQGGSVSSWKRGRQCGKTFLLFNGIIGLTKY